LKKLPKNYKRERRLSNTSLTSKNNWNLRRNKLWRSAWKMNKLAKKLKRNSKKKKKLNLWLRTNWCGKNQHFHSPKRNWMRLNYNMRK
jgi:hypothetical protein